MPDLNNDNELRKIIIQHYTHPTFKGLKHVKDAIRREVSSTTCADSLTIEYLIKDGVISSIAYDGSACVIAIAAADIWSGLIINHTLGDVQQIAREYTSFLTDGTCANPELLGLLSVFKKLHLQKNRIECAKLFTLVFQEWW